jgi:hypothetical protein
MKRSPSHSVRDTAVSPRRLTLANNRERHLSLFSALPLLPLTNGSPTGARHLPVLLRFWSRRPDLNG